MSNKIKMIASMLVGVGLGVAFYSGYQSITAEEAVTANNDEPKPLYWVAPMDDNYRRDKPGKSPMGMDLVPVYEESNSAQETGPGVVKINPSVVNNLGVRTAAVERSITNMKISTVGYVQYDEDTLVHIHPRVDGWIEQLFVKASGDPVTKGQALYTLYSPQLVNAQEEFLIALNRNNQSLISAAQERLKALQLSEQFIQQLKTTRKVQQTITFYSPQSGVVDGLKIREGFYVKPGNTLLSIAKLDSVWVEAEVFERDAGLIQQGLPVSMTLDYLPSKQWSGEVNYIYPTLNDKTRTLRVRLKFENPEHKLKPNMFAQVDILATPNEQAIIVPKEAVIRTGNQDRVVLALGDGQFKSIEVSIGRVNADGIEVLEGLNEDDVVVTSAQFLIDSESSKSSDFKRMSSEEQHQHEVEQPEVSSATVNGTINSIDAQTRIFNISRGPIEKWNRGPATMDFVIAEPLNISEFKVGDEVMFTFEIQDDFVITEMSKGVKHD